MGDRDEVLRLSVELERCRAENDQLRKWAEHLESSISALANGLANGLKEWVDALERMSPLRGGNGETLVEPD